MKIQKNLLEVFMSQNQENFNILTRLIKSVLQNEKKPIDLKKYVYHSVLISSTKTSLPYSKQEEEKIPEAFDHPIVLLLREITTSKYQEEVLKKLHGILDHEIDKECEEEEFEKFSEVARENARKVLDFIYNKFPQYTYDIYPTEDQEIAINCNPQKGKGVLVLCNSTGSLAYFATWDKENGMFRCNSNSMNDFLPHLNIAFERLVDHTTKEIVYLLNKNENNSFFIGPHFYEKTT